MKPVIVTTKHRGLFFGYTEDTGADPITLKNARCGIRWNTTGGFLELAEVGPNSGSRIGNRAPSIELRDITAVVELTEKAVKAWEDA